MPLDSQSLDLDVLEKSPGFLAGFCFDGRGLYQVAGIDIDSRKSARKTYAVWRILRKQIKADLLLVRSADRYSLATLRGGLILEAKRPMNIGILRHVLKRLDPITPPSPSERIKPSFEAAESAIWSVAKRLGRVEAPRVMEFIVGQYEYVLLADKSGFRIVDDDGGVERFVARMRDAIEQDLRIEYTFGAAPTGKPASSHRLSELFGANETSDLWTFAKTGWPTSVPCDATMAEVERAQRLCMSLLANVKSRKLVQVDMICADGCAALQATLSKDGVKLKLKPDA